MHENISYSFVEFVPTGEEEDGLQACELICTSTMNPAWPLIRYRVGDTALMDPNATCSAGKPGRIIERMYGRTSQFLETRDGRRISNISVMAKKCRNMRSCQAIQETPGEMTLLIVKDDRFVEADAKHAITEFRKKIGGEDIMGIHIEYADTPLLTKAGKFLMVVSKV
jgi:phenylacetate-CoA ligase